MSRPYVYPMPAIIDPQTGETRSPESPGISLRDHFAGLALHGLLTCERDWSGLKEKGGYAGYAYFLADKMLIARGPQ